MADGPEWFAAKRFGIGAGVPVSWQGWAILIAYGAIVSSAAMLLGDRPLALAGVVLPVTAVLMIVAAKTTRGGWRWRWGWKDRD